MSNELAGVKKPTTRDVAEVTQDEHGDDTHPAFGMIGASRVSSTPGAALFDSDVVHQHYVVLKIDRAVRKRDLNHDWIHSGGFGKIVEVAMSEAQWASLISSMNTAGVACTLRRTEVDGRLPDLEFESRLAVSHAETREAAHRAFDAIKEARDAYEQHKTAANLRNLHFAIENAPANVDFAAKSLTKHAENVVQKSRADLEAMVIQLAKQRGIDPDQLSIDGRTVAAGQIEAADEDAALPDSTQED